MDDSRRRSLKPPARTRPPVRHRADGWLPIPKSYRFIVTIRRGPQSADITLALGLSGLSDGPARGELGDAGVDLGKADILWIEDAAIPPDEALSLRVARAGHGVEELLEARPTANVFGRGAAGTLDEAGIGGCGIGGRDGLDGDRVPPIVAEVVSIGETLDASSISSPSATDLASVIVIQSPPGSGMP